MEKTILMYEEKLVSENIQPKHQAGNKPKQCFIKSRLLYFTDKWWDGLKHTFMYFFTGFIFKYLKFYIFTLSTHMPSLPFKKSKIQFENQNFIFKTMLKTLFKLKTPRKDALNQSQCNYLPQARYNKATLQSVWILLI